MEPTVHRLSPLREFKRYLNQLQVMQGSLTELRSELRASTALLRASSPDRPLDTLRPAAPLPGGSTPARTSEAEAESKAKTPATRSALEDTDPQLLKRQANFFALAGPDGASTEKLAARCYEHGRSARIHEDRQSLALHMAALLHVDDEHRLYHAASGLFEAALSHASRSVNQGKLVDLQHFVAAEFVPAASRTVLADALAAVAQAMVCSYASRYWVSFSKERQDVLRALEDDLGTLTGDQARAAIQALYQQFRARGAEAPDGRTVFTALSRARPVGETVFDSDARVANPAVPMIWHAEWTWQKGQPPGACLLARSEVRAFARIVQLLQEEQELTQDVVRQFAREAGVSRPDKLFAQLSKWVALDSGLAPEVADVVMSGLLAAAAEGRGESKGSGS